MDVRVLLLFLFFEAPIVLFFVGLTALTKQRGENRKRGTRNHKRGDLKSQNYFIVSEPPTEVCVAANFSLTRKAELHTLLLLGGSDAKLLNQ